MNHEEFGPTMGRSKPFYTRTSSSLIHEVVFARLSIGFLSVLRNRLPNHIIHVILLTNIFSLTLARGNKMSQFKAAPCAASSEQ